MAAYGFVETLKPEDYVAVVAYDMRPEILSDFTTDRMKTQEAMQRLRIAGVLRSRICSTPWWTPTDRMKDIEGRKAIVLIASGRDTFSKLTFDKARKRHSGSRRSHLRHRLAADAARIMADAYGPWAPCRAWTSCRPTTR